MKSEIKYINKSEFPCLMEYDNRTNNGRFIVLFSFKGTGTVIYSNNKTALVGHNSTNWHMEQFKSFDGVVELSNA